MAQNKTNIQWTDYTWNIARGCTKVDADCKYCYMYRGSLNNKRYNPAEVKKTKTVFNKPLKIKEPSKIFTSSLTDFYHPAIDAYRHEAFDIIRQCPQHTFQILTKHPERIEQHTPVDILAAHNVWFGTSVGSPEGISRIEALLKVKCRTRFVSFEPLHQRIDAADLLKFDLSKINWAVIGGESGNENGKYRYRPCELEWIKTLHDTLKPTTAVFVKQLGTHLAKELGLKDRHGGDISEFPINAPKTRDFPAVVMGADVMKKLHDLIDEYVTFSASEETIKHFELWEYNEIMPNLFISDKFEPTQFEALLETLNRKNYDDFLASGDSFSDVFSFGTESKHIKLKEKILVLWALAVLGNNNVQHNLWVNEYEKKLVK